MSVRGAGHLSDEQLASALAGSEAGETASHLADCPACRQDLDRLRGALLALREETRLASTKPDPFWISQRLDLAGKTPRQRLVHRFAWAAAGLALIAGLGGLYVNRKAQVRIVAVADPDHELLTSVERAIRRDVPRALEPAALLAGDLDRAARSSAGVKPPERR
jgi:hypothetical protein